MNSVLVAVSGLLLTSFISLARADNDPGRYTITDSGELILDDGLNELPQCKSDSSLKWLLGKYASLDITKTASSVVVNGGKWTSLPENSNGYLARDPEVPPRIRVVVAFWHQELTAHAWLMYAELDAKGRDKCSLARKMTGSYTK